MIHGLKYRGDRHCLKAIVESAQKAMPELSRWTMPVVPVPLHIGRLRQRGFNQSMLLAKELLPAALIRLDLLKRVRNTRPQVELDGEERRANVKGAFAASAAAKNMESAIVVDDVFTTGATLMECANVLVRAGVKKVEVFTVARVVTPP